MSEQPDVVLMDVGLEGGREGIETARWLREVCGASIVFITANNDQGTLARIHERVPGAPVLSKPVYREQLGAVSQAIHYLSGLSESKSVEKPVALPSGERT